MITLIDQIANLEQENAELRADYFLIRDHNKNLCEKNEKLKAEVEELKKVKKIFNEYMTTNITHVEINKLRELVKELSDELNLENSTIENHKKLHVRIKEVLG